ncbi:TfuA-like protein [Actinomadura sp. WAC 06369]|uniref:TfuA-like protein n=1 Tax=Actinomadura sp. WAC 06369 TaxID=2203193 RepID=UPI003FA361FC
MISPKEVLRAVDRHTAPVRVFGSSSMGALRAAELCEEGMVGVGQVFELYRSGAVEDDDEVSITFDPESLRPLCEPMVNIRIAVAAARARAVVSSMTAATVLATAKSLYFPDRTYDRIHLHPQQSLVVIARHADSIAHAPAGKIDVGVGQHRHADLAAAARDHRDAGTAPRPRQDGQRDLRHGRRRRLVHRLQPADLRHLDDDTAPHGLVDARTQNLEQRIREVLLLREELPEHGLGRGAPPPHGRLCRVHQARGQAPQDGSRQPAHLLVAALPQAGDLVDHRLPARHLPARGRRRGGHTAAVPEDPRPGEHRELDAGRRVQQGDEPGARVAVQIPGGQQRREDDPPVHHLEQDEPAHRPVEQQEHTDQADRGPGPIDLQHQWAGAVDRHRQAREQVDSDQRPDGAPPAHPAQQQHGTDGDDQELHAPDGHRSRRRAVLVQVDQERRTRRAHLPQPDRDDRGHVERPAEPDREQGRLAARRDVRHRTTAA